MRIIKVIFGVLVLLMLSALSYAAESYLTPDQIESELKNIAGSNDLAELSVLDQTAAGTNINMLKLGKNELPAIMVVANIEGDYPLASEAALRLIKTLVGDKKELLDKNRWYIIPLANPDGYRNFFNTPLYENFGNAHPVNDDNDDATDEDGPDDLNKDGYITVMRQKHPEGKYIPVADNPLLMKKAESDKGEKGIYRLFDEGLDNDGDGKINEDGPGGVNPGHNFPHNFEHYTKTDGVHAASEKESRSILEFAFDHPEIAMVINFGRTNSLKEVPKGNRRGEAADDKVKIPERWARRFGLDAETEYPVDDILDMARSAFGYPELDKETLLQWLGAGAAVNPDKNDVPYWEKISEEYNDFIKEAGFDGKRLSQPTFSNGSLEEWAYYQFGVPTYAIDFWTVPEAKKEEPKENDSTLTADDIEKMSNEDFIALGEDKINELLKSVGAPAGFTAERVIKGIEAGRMDTKRMAKFMRENAPADESGADKQDLALLGFDPGAFVSWTKYDHPTLGEVEIGGEIPYARLAPPPTMIDSLIDGQLPFVFTLTEKLPQINIGETKIEKVSSDVWRLTVWAENNGFLPYPTYQGKRCGVPYPLVVSIENSDLTILEGKKRVTCQLLEGTNGNQKIEWLFQAPSGTGVKLKLGSPACGYNTKTVTLK